MYRLTTDDQSSAQIDALPAEALPSYAEVVGVLQLVPWHGKPYADAKPDGPMRHLFFGHRSMVVYLILEDQLRVECLAAAETHDLTGVVAWLENCGRRAVLVEHLGVEGYRNMLADAEERLRTGVLPEGSVPWER